MRKLIIFFILCSTLVYGQDGHVKFKIKANHYYEFTIPLREITQYKFTVTGEQPCFDFQIIEPGNNAWEKEYSILSKQLIIYENIMDSGEYTIKIFSIYDNFMTLTWQEY